MLLEVKQSTIFFFFFLKISFKKKKKEKLFKNYLCVHIYKKKKIFL